MTGFTVALSWELPSQPTYPEWEQVGTSNADPEFSFSLKNRKDKNSPDPAQIIPSDNSASNLTSKESTLRDQEANFKNHIRNYYEFLKHRYPNPFDKKLLKKGKNLTDIKFPYSPDYNASNNFDAFTQYMVGSYFEPLFDSEQRRFT